MDDFTKRILKLQAQRDFLELTATEINNSIIKTESDIKTFEEVREIIIALSEESTCAILKTINNIVSLCLSSVYENTGFELIATTRKDRTEFVPYVIENGEQKSVKDDVSGGMLNLIGFGFRVALITLYHDELSQIIIMDEPFRFLGELVHLTGEMLSEIQKNTGLQIILATHDRELKAISDKVFLVRKNERISYIQ